MLDEEFKGKARFPTNKGEAINYAREMAEGIKLWTIADIIILAPVTYFYISGSLKPIIFKIIVVTVIGLPIIMVAAYSIGCLKYLRVTECLKAVWQKWTG